MVGLLGSLHCIGMCGPLVLAFSIHVKTPSSTGQAAEAAQDGRAGALGLSGAVPRLLAFQAVPHHLAFHSGRILSYGVLGAVFAALFESLEVHEFAAQYRGGFFILSGLLLVALGLVLLRLIPVPSFLVRLSSAGPLGRTMAVLANSRNLASRVGLGLAAGLLPCGLTWAMLVTAASTLDPAKGFLTMTSFGLGTTPLLLLTGVAASFISAKTRLLGEKAAAVAVIAMGLALLAKGGAILCGISHHCS